MDRINILSIIYSTSPPKNLPSSSYTGSIYTASQPPSPMSDASSYFSVPLAESISSRSSYAFSFRSSLEVTTNDTDMSDSDIDTTSFATLSPRTSMDFLTHPNISAPPMLLPLNNRRPSRRQVGQLRAISTLPPPTPPPTSALPPEPTSLILVETDLYTPYVHIYVHRSSWLNVNIR